MQRNVYYIDIDKDVRSKLENHEQTRTDDPNPYLQMILAPAWLRTLDDSSGNCDSGRVYLEGKNFFTPSKCLCYCISFPVELRASIAALSRPTDNNYVALTERIAKKYEEVLDVWEKMLQKIAGLGEDRLVVMKNLSFGDACIVCVPLVDENVENMVEHITATLTELSLKYASGSALDTPDETITTISEQIKKRFYSTYLIKRNANYTEYETLMKQLMEASVGSNDRKMYVLMLCALLLRTILDEASVRWVYESGDTKYEPLELSMELTRAYEICMAGFREFLNQASIRSPYSDQIWSLFFITKTLLSSIVGRDSESIKRNSRDAENLDDAELLQEYCNFFGFVPYIGDRYAEVTSYYPSHIAPDYCYGFFSIPRKEEFRFWSFFPAYIHEFYHYIPPRGRKERNEKILHLAVYSIMTPLLEVMGQSRKAEYERIVARIASSVEQLRENLIDLRNDRNHALSGSQTYATRQSVENYRDTMKYNAIMEDLVYLLDFEDLCTEAVNEFCSENVAAKAESSSIPDRGYWMQKCADKWDKNMTGYIATFSFAMREIRSDLSMCVLLDMSLRNYIEVLAKEPGFAESSQTWVADSTVLRFGFMTRLLYTKELYYDSWEKVDWRELCKCMDCTCSQNDPDGNSICGWKKKCGEILQSLRKNGLLCNEYLDHLDHLGDYLSIYVKISSSSDDSPWNSVFEKAMCTGEYAISSPENGSNQFVDRRYLIPCWGVRLQKHRGYPFVRLLNDLYCQYSQADTVEAKCRIEYQSRLLFRDLLMYFEDIDLPNNAGHDGSVLS